MSIVYVNSTLPFRQRIQRAGTVSPLHTWGYSLRAGDVLLAHRMNRVEITLRHKLGGLDLTLLLRTCWHLARGATGVYLVTQPDLWQALPFLRRCFGRRRFVTWAWMDWEVERHQERLRVCDHVFCLTEGAKRRCDELGMEGRASLAIWGGDPACFRRPATNDDELDVLVAGLASRDTVLLAQAFRLGRCSIGVTRESKAALARGLVGVDLHGVADVGDDLVAAMHRCRVAWIPLKRVDPYPTGYTNLIESLLCGTAVLIADSSTIPECVLSLPGVFRYRAESLDDFVARNDDALAYARLPGARERIATAAAVVLNGRELAAAIDRIFA